MRTKTPAVIPTASFITYSLGEFSVSFCDMSGEIGVFSMIRDE